MPTSILLGVDTGHKQFGEALCRDNPAPAKTSGFVYIRSSQSLSSSSTSNASLTTNLISSDDIAICLTEVSILLHRKEIYLASNSNSIKLYIRSLLERYQVRRMKCDKTAQNASSVKVQVKSLRATNSCVGYKKGLEKLPLKIVTL